MSGPFLIQSACVGSEIKSGDSMSCLPLCMDVNVNDSNGNFLQSFQIDTSCTGRNLLLKEPYGSIEFNGYSCNQMDVHNCYQEIA